MNKETILIEQKPYTLGELAQIYKVHRDTFRKWILPFKSELGKREGNYYSVIQVKTIFKKLGYPSYIKVSVEEEESVQDFLNKKDNK